MLRYTAFIVALCSCGDGTPVRATFVTEAFDDGGPVSIAIVVDGARVAAYACADDVASDRYPGWFVGDTHDGRFDLALDGWTLSGHFSADGAEGTIVEPDGTAVAFASARASDSDLTGVYRDDTGMAGVIVLADGTGAPVVRGAWRNVLQVTPVLPLEIVDDRMVVDVSSWRLSVERVRAVTW